MSEEEQRKSLEAYLSHVRHELRNPLNNIIGYCELVMEVAEEREEEDLMDDLRRIQTASQLLHELIGTLLEADRFEAGPTVAAPSRPRDGADTRSVSSALALPVELTEIVLPSTLYAALRDAVEAHNVTEVKQCLDNMEMLGEAEQPLTQHLRGLVWKFDMDAIKIVLETVTYE